jgi:site-specific DNA-methyltransferase (adenine-specific)
LLDKPYYSGGAGNNAGSKNNHKLGLKKVAKEYLYSTPDTILVYKPQNNVNVIHPTQKPVALFEYLIKTYTKENDIVLDNCMGSGTTAIACMNTKRNYIGMELDKEYFDIAEKRIKENKQYIKRQVL